MTTPIPTHPQLKARQRAERDGHPPNLALRVHRALSWLGRAEGANDDPDGRFLFLWIAFNAAYATEIEERYRATAQETFRDFIAKLIDLDGRQRLAGLVWTEFTQSIRVLLDNPYLFADFWEFHTGRVTEAEWKRRFESARHAAKRALAEQDTTTVLSIVLGRIYVLRNQLVHGGATWNSSVNREQIRDCNRFLGKLVPVLIEIMLDHPETLWGEACWPVVKT
jgi:hypothetical protein